MTELRVEDRDFILPIRVYYEDTDAGGVVYYANYLKYAERARTEALRHLDIHSSQLQDDHGLGFVVRNLEVEYLQPARLDDLIEVHLRLTSVGGASLEGEQIIRRGEDDLVRIKIRLGCMKLSGGPGRFPAEIRDKLKLFVSES